MKSVYIVQHMLVLPQGEEEIKFIGAYSSAERAKEAVERLNKQPGFRDHPRIIDPLVDDDTDGFYIDEYTIDEDNWADGYVKG